MSKGYDSVHFTRSRRSREAMSHRHANEGPEYHCQWQSSHLQTVNPNASPKVSPSSRLNPKGNHKQFYSQERGEIEQAAENRI